MKPANIAVNTSNPRLEKQGRKRVSNAPRLSGMLTLRGIGGTLLQWWCCMHHQCSAQFHQTPGRRAEETAKNSIPSATDSQDGLDGLPVEWNRRTSHIVTKLRETAKVEFHPNPQPADPLFYTIHAHHKTTMSDDNAARIIRRYAQAAHRTCAEVPVGAHPHMLRHSRAMHLYQAGMPLALLTEWLGHADPETTLIYAHADTEMKRQAIEKATANGAPSPQPIQAVWHDNEDILNRLLGLSLRLNLGRRVLGFVHDQLSGLGGDLAHLVQDRA
jgi:hypothetical protein